MDKSNATLDRMLTFVRVVERGSLSAVARELELGQSTVTRQLKELEEAIGVPLLIRTTRRVAITGEGLRYYANCLNILRLVEQAQDEARSIHSAPAGNVRISCTSAFGVMHMCRILFAFQRLHPEIAVDLNLTDEKIDLHSRGGRYRDQAWAAERQLDEASRPRNVQAVACGLARISRQRWAP